MNRWVWPGARTVVRQFYLPFHNNQARDIPVFQHKHGNANTQRASLDRLCDLSGSKLANHSGRWHGNIAAYESLWQPNVPEVGNFDLHSKRSAPSDITHLVVNLLFSSHDAVSSTLFLAGLESEMDGCVHLGVVRTGVIPSTAAVTLMYIFMSATLQCPGTAQMKNSVPTKEGFRP